MEIAGNPRIEELKKRVEKDPTSIAFAQLAEEYRRTGGYQQAVDVCRDGLSRHPGYVSARVTLARALMELDQFGDAKQELQAVLSVAPDNLAAIRALADIHQKAGEVDETFHLDVAAPAPAPVDAGSASPDEMLGGTRPTKHAPLDDAPLNDALPSFDALESLLLDLPPLPDMNWDLDAALQVDAPSPSEPTAPAGPTEPGLRELEGWLDAILADRSQTR